MTATMTVQMSEQQQAVVSFDGVKIQDARGYSPRLLTVMNLEDAILLAQTILAFASDSADDVIIRRWEDEQFARWQANDELTRR